MNVSLYGSTWVGLLLEKFTLVCLIYLVLKNFYYWLKFKDKTFIVLFKNLSFLFFLINVYALWVYSFNFSAPKVVIGSFLAMHCCVNSSMEASEKGRMNTPGQVFTQTN